MKERPILFSGEMVRAILEDRKTQTRRIVKRVDGKNWLKGAGNHVIHAKDKCPYGQPGDRLWVRETFFALEDYPIPGTTEKFWYRADEEVEIAVECEPDEDRPRWTPSIQMPRWASRLTLEITNIRVERLQDISEEDAKEEGVELYKNYDGTCGGWSAPETYKSGFKLLWESINGAGSWERNDWVWVIEFRRITK